MKRGGEEQFCDSLMIQFFLRAMASFSMASDVTTLRFCGRRQEIADIHGCCLCFALQHVSQQTELCLMSIQTYLECTMS